MKFKNFTLDQFQVDSIKAIDKNNSVLVSAGTGTGKTLIADYIIDKYLPKGKRIIYTAPIKALSGQKYRDFKKEYGEENIGIMTGDIVINGDAPVLIMTTEIYRNMLLAKDPIVDHVSYVIFDEIHYINDIERGTIWEESIIFSPSHVRFLSLSATIPNAKEFAKWIETIKKHVVEVIIYDHRAVPLEHHVYDVEKGIIGIDELIKDKNFGVREKKFKNKNSKNKQRSIEPPHITLIKQINDKLPCIFFNFSRKECEKKAIELSRVKDYLTKEQKAEIATMYSELITPEYRSLESIQKLRQTLSKGVGFHHAGVLPKAKELVELLFAKGILKVLYATETFAVGINMPAKTVCFASLEKYDGVNFRYINAKEYFQMAGRAGRRGIDTIGYSVAMVERGYTDLSKVKAISSKDDIPIVSQFKLSINTVLNLIKNHNPQEREKILKMNFDYFLKKKKSDRQVRIMASYNNRVRLLTKMGYISEDGNSLTEKGNFATKIYFQEILLTEIFCTEKWKVLDAADINILIAGIIYEPRRKDYFTLKGMNKRFNKIMAAVSGSSYIAKNLNKLHVKRMVRVVGDFTEGETFKNLLEMSNLDEGDLIRLFRRIIDTLRQLRHSTDDYDLKDKLHECQEKIYREVVRFEF